MTTTGLSVRMNGVSESATLKLNAAAQALRAKGKEIFNLTAGEPDFAVPEACKDAVRAALDTNKSKYTPTPGILELRELVAQKTNHQCPSLSSPFTAADVVITNGGKQAIYNAMQVLLNPGDEVFYATPYWLSYPEMARLASAKGISIETDFNEGFKLSPAKLESALKSSKNAKMFVINSPSNPSGVMYSKNELADLGKVLEKFPNVWILSDEIYDRVVYKPHVFCSFLDACPSLRDRTVTVNGLSKSAAMTGWRIGWSVANKQVTSAMSTLQGQSTSGICALTQAAGVAALKLPEKNFDAWTEAYTKRREIVLKSLENLQKQGKIKVYPPEGAFYVFVGVGGDSFQFCEQILDREGVALIPGAPFGAEGWIRLSFATDEATLLRGCQKLVNFLSM